MSGRAIMTDRPIVRLAACAMGTRFELLLHGDDPARLHAIGEECVREIEWWHRRLSAFAPDSDIARINRSAGTALRVDAELFELLGACARMRVDSGGLFDVTMGAVMRRHGLHPDAESEPAETDATGDGSDDTLVLDSEALTVRLAAGSMLDLGGVAKGFALDRVHAILREHGVNTGLVHGGTSGVVALGAPPEMDGWRIAIRSDGEARVVTLRDSCLAVSRTVGRISGQGAAAVGHIVDPRVGSPLLLSEVAGTGADTAAVMGPSAMVCDAWTKAALLTGGRPAKLPCGYEVQVHRGDRGWDTHGLTGLDAEVVGLARIGVGGID